MLYIMHMGNMEYEHSNLVRAPGGYIWRNGFRDRFNAAGRPGCGWMEN